MDAANETPAATARRLMRGLDRAALSTLLGDAGGWPYGSLVLVALDHAARPILLISELAEHTRNIDRDGRVSLLFDGTVGAPDPLAAARVTVLGTAHGTTEPALRERYLARHPGARTYAGFKDFHLYLVRPSRAHLVAGFGRIHWIDGAALLFDDGESAALAAAEADILAHMNAEHADTLRRYAEVLLGRPGGAWRMTGCDPEGIDLRCGAEVARLDFERPVADAEAARKALVELARRARAAVAD